jgi:hypothetical protein
MNYNVIRETSIGPDYIKLYIAADNIIDYRQNIYNVTGEDRYDLLEVSRMIQKAAKVAQKSTYNNNAMIYELLMQAASKSSDMNIRNNIFRLIFEMGWACPSHGSEIIKGIESGDAYFGKDGEYHDSTCFEPDRCAICGEIIYPMTEIYY